LQLNHLNLCVPNLADAVSFFETFFDFRYLETKGRDTLAVLEGQGSFTLVLSNFNKEVTPVYPDGFHIGFLVKTPEEVQHKYDQLIQAGLEIPHAPRTMHGAHAFYCIAPGLLLIEVSCPI
jgi:catechol 2,3-dioxygenase-like lactoylglutathione lyase family enzyme